MNTPISPHCALAVLIASIFAPIGLAQTTPPRATLLPLGLPRLQASAESPPDQPAPVPASKFAVEPLAAAGSAVLRRSAAGDVEWLSLSPAETWTRPLRGRPKDPVFVSISAQGSLGTFLEIGPLRIGLIQSDLVNHAQLMWFNASGQWQSLGLNLPLERYGGQPMASIPVLTVRLDPAAQLFDVFLGARQLADNLPLDLAKDQRRVTLIAGEAGAWLAGVVQSDENPLYADANANGIDDAFEQAKRGNLLAATATSAERKLLAAEWRTHQRTVRPPARFRTASNGSGRAPYPDSAAWCQPRRSPHGVMIATPRGRDQLN